VKCGISGKIYGVGSIHQVQISLQLRIISPSGHHVIYIVSFEFAFSSSRDYTVRLPSLQICFTLGNRNDRPSRLEEADSEKYSTVTSLPTCRQLAPGSVAHNQFWVLPKLNALVGGETTSNGYPHSFMFNPDVCHQIIFPINPIYGQPHP
jgi:hypothetical protein